MTDKIVIRWIVICTVLGLAAWSMVDNPFQFGIDLRGGTTLTYSVDDDALRELQQASDLGQDSSPDEALVDTVRVISTRINALGVKDLAVRREGRRRILIQAPDMSKDDLAGIKERMVQLGQLEFPIGIGGETDGLGPDLPQDVLRYEEGPGEWKNIKWDQAKANEQRDAAIARDWPLILAAEKAGRIPDHLYRPGRPFQYSDPDTGKKVPIWWKPWAPGEATKIISRKSAGKITPDRTECLLALQNARDGLPYNKDYVVGGWLWFDTEWYGPGRPGFTGADIGNVRRDIGGLGDRAVSYTVSRNRQGDFYDYTKKYVRKAKCLVLNDEIWSNPTIRQALSESVQITGGGSGFTKKEQDWLIDCLQSGSLKLRPILESTDEVDPTLGEVAKNRGILATLLGGALVIVFMIFYYRFSGVVAVLSLILNLGLMLAMLALFEATITLPGIAGIILTIGMSVDANILIFERIREELAKGKALVASVQAGFDRAFVTIIDANLTTMITAIILYQYGVGPIKGFAVTLMAGITCSLFTALFVSKALFATALSQGWLSGSLRMRQLVRPDLRLDFTGKARSALTASVIGVLAALAIFFGSNPYGLDFTGGTIVRVSVLEGTVSGQALKDTVLGIKKEGRTLYPEVNVIGLSNLGEFPDDPNSYSQYDIHIQDEQTTSASELSAVVEPDFKKIWGDEFQALSEPTQVTKGGDWEIEVEIKTPLTLDDIETQVGDWRDDKGRAPYETARFRLTSPSEDDQKSTQFRIFLNERNFIGQSQILDQLATLLSDHLPKKPGDSETKGIDYAKAFPKLNFIGPNVVADLKKQAIVAILLSLIALILYIWFRFKELKYGFAAAIAVFHDVIIALGVVVVVNRLGIVHVPINLPIIAGFLTIIGYSLNDTIVLFDRVRENQGNVTGSFAQVVNLSINQTLARTLLTSITTFAVVLVLFALNYGAESPIEGIAFTLMIGVLVGTYSSIFVASPMVIWMHSRAERKRASADKGQPQKI